jgi:hypothetical protein
MIDDGRPYMRVSREEEESGGGCMGKGVLVALVLTIALAIAGYVIAKVL